MVYQPPKLFNDTGILKKFVDIAVLIPLILCVFYIISPLSASAGFANIVTHDDVFGSVLCTVYLTLIGVPGKVVGCIAVTWTCVGALFGKTSWSLALVVIISIGGALGAHHIVRIIVISIGGDVDGAMFCL